jgi:hypothetical protein
MISYASSISRQILERIETIETDHGNVRHCPKFTQAQVYGDAAPSCLSKLPRPPECHAATCAAEVKLDCLPADVRDGRTEDVDSLAFIVIRPKRSVAAAHGAVARIGGRRQSAELPANRTAMAGPSIMSSSGHQCSSVSPFQRPLGNEGEVVAGAKEHPGLRVILQAGRPRVRLLL